MSAARRFRDATIEPDWLLGGAEDLLGYAGIHLGANAAGFEPFVRLHRAKVGILQRLKDGRVALLLGGHHLPNYGESEHLVDKIDKGEGAADRKQFHVSIKKDSTWKQYHAKALADKCSRRLRAAEVIKRGHSRHWVPENTAWDADAAQKLYRRVAEASLHTGSMGSV